MTKPIGSRIPTNRTTAIADSLVSDAAALETEQQASLEAAPVEQAYQESLAMYVQAKHGQVEVIEDRLEDLIGRQQARLQQMQSSPPGLLSKPSTKRAWQTAQHQQRGRLHSLNNRLQVVREIKDGMGLHSPRVEELATRKMRLENPDLASDWDMMRETHRIRQELLRKEQQQSRAQSVKFGLTQSLSPTKS